MSEDRSTLLPRKTKARAANPRIPTLTVMTHPDPDQIGKRAFLANLNRGKEVRITRTEPLFHPPGSAVGASLADPYISRKPIVVRVAGDQTLEVDTGATQTELSTPFPCRDDIYRIPLQRLERGVPLMLGDRIMLLLHWSAIAETPHDEITRDHGLVGASAAVMGLRAEIERVADLKTPVLLRGASGTGKELVAHAIHGAHPGKRPFIGVNLGAIPASLAASELFGAVRGSFTGASRDQSGFFRAAQGGTLFLDEVGEASTEVQVMLLRALETGEICPVGAQQSIRVQTRVIAATDADLEEKMAQDSFKTPLFHRLAGYEIHLPPLRDRLEDFSRLFFHFARKELDELGESHRLVPRGVDQEPWFPPDLVSRLLEFHWPGNIRQLRNVVRQLVIGCRGKDQLYMDPKLTQLLGIPDSGAPPTPLPSQRTTLKRKPASVSVEEIRAALARCDGDIKSAANHLGISRAGLYHLIEKTPGLKTASDLDVADIERGLQEHHGDLQALAKHFGISRRALRRRMTLLGL